jgi:hypothetical protein
LVNTCTKCNRFVKNDVLPQTIQLNGFGEVKEPLMGKCERCGDLEVNWFRN